MVARINNVYRPQLPMITIDIPQPVVPCYLGTVRFDESADTRKRSWERVDSRTYLDSEDSEDDVVYAEEHENEIQQINLRNEVTNQMTGDTCGERCARLDDFNWVLPAKVWNEESDTPESDFETSDSGIVFMSTLQIRLHLRRKRRRSGCQAPRWSLRRDLRGAVRQQCPGESAGGGVSGRRTVLQRWIQDRSMSPQVHWILRGYIAGMFRLQSHRPTAFGEWAPQSGRTRYSGGNEHMQHSG